MDSSWLRTCSTKWPSRGIGAGATAWRTKESTRVLVADVVERERLPVRRSAPPCRAPDCADLESVGHEHHDLVATARIGRFAHRTRNPASRPALRDPPGSPPRSTRRRTAACGGLAGDMDVVLGAVAAHVQRVLVAAVDLGHAEGGQKLLHDVEIGHLVGDLCGVDCGGHVILLVRMVVWLGLMGCGPAGTGVGSRLATGQDFVKMLTSSGLTRSGTVQPSRSYSSIADCAKAFHSSSRPTPMALNRFVCRVTSLLPM